MDWKGLRRTVCFPIFPLVPFLTWIMNNIRRMKSTEWFTFSNFGVQDTARLYLLIKGFAFDRSQRAERIFPNRWRNLWAWVDFLRRSRKQSTKTGKAAQASSKELEFSLVCSKAVEWYKITQFCFGWPCIGPQRKY